jgi:hypothetical protein
VAIIKAAKGGRTLKQAIDYANKDKMLLGKDCPDDPQLAKEQMQITKEIFDKTDGRQYKHYIQSFDIGETTPEQAQEIGLKWAKENFKEYEVVVGTHKDTDHIHNHIVVNSVNFEDGSKIHLDKEDLERFKSVSDELCKEYGLSTIDRTKTIEKGEIRAYDMDKYQVMKQGNSFIQKTACSVEKSINNSQSKEEFIKGMKDQGYQVNWEDHKKHITFTDRDGNKVRATNLEKTFSDPMFSKEGLIKRIEQNQEKSKEIQPKNTMEYAQDLQTLVGEARQKMKNIDAENINRLKIFEPEAKREIATNALKSELQKHNSAKEILDKDCEKWAKDKKIHDEKSYSIMDKLKGVKSEVAKSLNEREKALNERKNTLNNNFKEIKRRENHMLGDDFPRKDDRSSEDKLRKTTEKIMSERDSETYETYKKAQEIRYQIAKTIPELDSMAKDLKELPNEKIQLPGDSKNLASVSKNLTKYKGKIKEIKFKKAINEINKAASITKLSQNPHPKDLYQSYAKKITEQNGGLWKPEQTDQAVVVSMALNGIDRQRISDSLRFSPAHIEKNGMDKVSAARDFVNNTFKQPQNKKALDLVKQRENGLER